MGIKGLWDAVAAAGVSSRVELLRGKKVAIDASFWIGHCLASETAVRRGNDIYGVFFLRICYLLEKRIYPIFVFDGRTPAAKRRTILMRNMARARRTRNLKLLAFKALAVQMKHLAKPGNKRLFKPSSFMKRKHPIPMHELKKISAELDDIKPTDIQEPASPVLAIEDVAPGDHPPTDEPLFSSDDEFDSASSSHLNYDEELSGTAPSTSILTMPRSYSSLKMLLRSGANVDIDANTTEKQIDNAYIDAQVARGSHGKGSNRSKRRIELPLDCTINPQSYERLPPDIRYQIMQQIKDAWMYDDRLNLQNLGSSLDAFSNLQVESYLRDVEINREIEKIKRSLVPENTPAIKNEPNAALDAPPDGGFDNAIFDYNAVEHKPRRKKGFLNDLSVNMTPDLYTGPISKLVKSEPDMVDDTLFMRDSEIFGDLVKSESEDEFEEIDRRHVANSPDSFEILEEYPMVKCEIKDELPEYDDKVCSHNVLDQDLMYSSLKHQDTVAANNVGGETSLTEEGEGNNHTVRTNVGNISNGSSDGSDSDFSDLSYSILGHNYQDPMTNATSKSSGSIAPTSELDDEWDLDDSDTQSQHYSEVSDDYKEGSITSQLPEFEDSIESATNRDSAPIDATKSTETCESPTCATESPTDPTTGLSIVPEDTDVNTGPSPDGPTQMYSNEWEYRGFLQMEKMFSHVDRSQYRMDEWDKVPILLELFGVPFLVAPSEAEAQCAHLNNMGLCFGVISDDSDTLAFGARRVFKNFYSGSVFEVYVADRIVKELGLGREQIALLAIICGCDYTPGVRGIGVVNALEVIKAFPTFDELYEFRRWATSDCDLATVTEDECPIKRAYKESHVNYRLHWSFGSDFPNREAYNLLLSPVVSDTFEPHWEAPRYEEILRFMEKHSSFPASEVATCLSKLRCHDDFDGYILEDFVPEIHSKTSLKGRKSLKGNRKVLQQRMSSFREFLTARDQRKSRKAGSGRSASRPAGKARDRVAYIRSKRMLESIEGIRQRVHGENGVAP
ncbi:XPG N-terminal domain-containing protein [Babesia ovis]|uniref:XPG N-terminal domain-containing protein n=1 Tax=Babesia ovis TaxID=5869 RepID=A0A9W5WV04_BABOV|nr:XPG N-terminal domain-containing protein [Babesia ovis]